MASPHINLVQSIDGQRTAMVGPTKEDCEREPIHIPGAIQPHGALVAFEPGSSIIRHASANLKDWFPVGALPSKGRALTSLVDAATWEQLQRVLRVPSTQGVRHVLLPIGTAAPDAKIGPLEGVVHRHRGQCVLEIEPRAENSFNGIQAHSDVTTVLRAAGDLEDLLTRTALQVKRLTGFDRVLVYRFDDDWHGEVVAEAREEDMEPFLGLHYPASDIPAQARELYRTNLVRYIADVRYTPVPVVPWADPLSNEPLDMSHSVLRSVSPMHLQYLENMGVRASLTMSIVIDEKLWGMVSCHHREPRHLALAVRQTCTALSLSCSYLVSSHLQKARLEAASRASHFQSRVLGIFNQADVPLRDAVEHSSAALLHLLGATGGALWHRGEWVSFGLWPPGDLGKELQSWAELKLATSNDDLQSFESVDFGRPLAPAELKAACGAVIVRLGDFTDSGVMWLRPEYRREVAWGGDPEKPVSVTQNTQGRETLSPRASFEKWATLVQGRCRSWTEFDLEAARSILPLRQMLAARDSLAEARESDRRFRALLELQSDAYWQIDGGGSLVVLSKPLPVDLGPVENRLLVDVFADACTDTSVAALRRALAQGEPFRDVRLTSRSDEPDKEFEVLVSGDPLRDRQDRAVGFHGTLTDVSQALRAGRELRMREAAELANRTKSRFLSQVSHELRTPLNAVLGYAQLLVEDPAASPMQRDHAQNIEKAGQWLLAMISDLLDIARIEAGRIDLDLQVVNPASVVERALAALLIQGKNAGISISYDAPSAPMSAHADETRLTQVLLNLISNAIKYNRPGGRVSVAVSQPSPERVVIAVTDTGQGLDAEQLKHIFEPFNRLGRENQSTPGTGIGLVIARQLAEAMGGRIEVRSEPGVGSSFELSLVAANTSAGAQEADRLPPLPHELNQGVSRTTASSLPTGSPKGVVLYVEDEETNVELMRAVVDSTQAAAMVHAATAEEGLRLAAEMRPEVMLIDLNLPGKDGAWLLSAIRSDPVLARTHCVAVTADAMRETHVRLRGLGFDQCWTKPLALRWAGRALRAALQSISLGVNRSLLRFEDANIFEPLASAPDVWLDTLDFGVVRLDSDLRTTAYNLHESLFTGYEPAAVMGRHFFKDIGPCMDNPLVAGRLAGNEPVDAILDYVFRMKLKREPVRLRILVEPSSTHRFLLVDSLR